MPLLFSILLCTTGTNYAFADSFEQTALTGSLRELANFSAEIAPLNDVRIFDQLSLIYAARNFDPDRLEVIIQSHTALDIADETGTTAVMHALMAGRIKNAQLLHDRGASLEGINNQGYTVRWLAEEAGLPDFGPAYETSLSGPTVDHEDANKLLLLAAEAGDTTLVDWALSLGADLSTQAANDLQAAHLTALGGHEQTFDHILSHEAAPTEWATLRNAETFGEVFTVADFIIAGEGGGDHNRADHMLIRALQDSTLAAQIRENQDRYREAMLAIGYPVDMVVTHFGAPELPSWSIGIPAWGSARGGTPEEWRQLQRFLADEGLYTSGIDGNPGRGTLRAIVMHTAKHLPDLIERVDIVQDLVTAPEPQNAKWLTAAGRWHLALAEDETGLPLGYTLTPRDSMRPTGRIELVPQGQSYRFRPFDGRSYGSDLIQFTYSDPEQDHIAWLNMPVLGATLQAIFYEDRFTYELQGVTRQYTATEDVPWVVGLHVQ